MSFTTLLAMFSFCLIMSISPGPVNMMIVSSGINHGFKKTMTFVLGATVGFTLLLLIIGLGFTKVLDKYPAFLSYLEIFGSFFIIYMGYKIATSSSSLDVSNEDNKTLKFYEGFLLQWLNPKAWIASISGVSMFVVSDNILLLFVVMYFIVCYVSLSFWGILGEKATIFLSTDLRLKVFNIVMGMTLIISAISLLYVNTSS